MRPGALLAGRLWDDPGEKTCMYMQSIKKVHQISSRTPKKDHITVKVSRKLMHQVNWHWIDAGDLAYKVI
jgi:hypothetical protein